MNWLVICLIMSRHHVWHLTMPHQHHNHGHITTDLTHLKSPIVPPSSVCDTKSSMPQASSPQGIGSDSRTRLLYAAPSHQRPEHNRRPAHLVAPEDGAKGIEVIATLDVEERPSACPDP
jgi:hypothetical protein